jgi:hypothetical protein
LASRATVSVFAVADNAWTQHWKMDTVVIQACLYRDLYELEHSEQTKQGEQVNEVLPIMFPRRFSPSSSTVNRQVSGFNTTNEFILPKRKISIVSSRGRRTQALLLPVTLQCVRSYISA